MTPHLGEDVEEHREQRAGHAHAAGPDAPAEREHALGVDAHQRGGLAVLGGRLEREARLGAADEPVQPREGGEGAHAGHELRQAQEEPADRDPALDEGILDHQEVHAPERLGRRAQEHREPEGGEDLGQHRGVEDPADEAPVGRGPEREEQADGEGQRDERIEPPERPRPVAREHGDHQELAVGEVDDLHQPEDQRESGRDQRVDEAHEQTADDALQEDLGGHGGRATGTGLLLLLVAGERVDHVGRRQVERIDRRVGPFWICWRIARTPVFWPFSSKRTPVQGMRS